MMDLINIITEHTQVINRTFTPEFLEKIEETGFELSRRLRAGGKIIFMGNGGSAADAQHLAAEFISKLTIDRQPLAAIALTVDTSILTAISNDYGYEHVFARQIEALAKPDDVIIGISTSGQSKNVIYGFLEAKSIGAYTIGFCGCRGFPNCDLDVYFSIESANTARIQEAHIILGHMLCGIAESGYV